MEIRQTHCLTCGSYLEESVVLAKDYTRPSMSGMFDIGYEEFGHDGWRQELLRFKCPKYGEKKGRFFKKTVPHTLFCREIGGYKYATKVAGTYF